jgi:hypothetical protein
MLDEVGKKVPWLDDEKEPNPRKVPTLNTIWLEDPLPKHALTSTIMK